MNLLIVDDEPLEREVLIRIVQKEKLRIEHVVEAKHGLDAVQLARAMPIDLVLMDIDMPVMDGFAAANLIRKERPNCPIIFLTADNEAILATQQQATYLFKPAHPKDIIEAITKHIPAEKSAFNPLERYRHPDIQKVTTYIQQNLHLDLKLDNLAELVHFNSQYISRLFKQETNYTLTQYITACRMEKATYYLRYASDVTIGEISQKCGIPDANYFARVFKKYEGITPSEYQRQAHFNRKKRMNAFNNFLM